MLGTPNMLRKPWDDSVVTSIMVSDHDYNSHKNDVINEPSLIMIHNVVTIQEQLSMVTHGL